MKNLILLILLLARLTGLAHAQTTITDSLVAEGVMRHYHVYIPKNFVAGSHRPLIIHLHGYSSNGGVEQLYTNYMPVADTAGFLVAYPEGLADASQHQYWTAGIPGIPNSHNDVIFLSDLIDSLQARNSIDSKRVYASGLSNGGYMCYQLAWKLANKIVAIASVSGSMAPIEFARCKPTQAVPVMEIHGTADNVVPYATSNISTNIDSLLHFWVVNDGCIPLPGITNLPDKDPTDGTIVIHYQWSAELRNTACELYKIIGGAHVDWPGAGAGNNGDFSASTAIWNFFNRYQLPPPAQVDHPSDQTSNLNFYPNPCRDILHVTPDVDCITTITDITGRKVVTSIEKDIDVSRLLRGFYEVQCESGGIVKIGKLLKY